MTAYRAIVAERRDLAVVTIVCVKCSCEVSIPVETAAIPEGCPSCGMEYDSSTRGALAGLSRFHKEAVTAEEFGKRTRFRFSIKQMD